MLKTLVRPLSVLRGAWGYWRYTPRQSRRLFSAVPKTAIPDFFLACRDSRPGCSGYSTVRVKGYPGSLTLRNGTSDFAVFCQIFLEAHYANLPVDDAKVIIDAGANIGLSAIYFLMKYPDARVIALEPDPENLEIARRNLLPFADRCLLQDRALWTHDRGLELQRTGEFWATQVKDRDAAQPGREDVVLVGSVAVDTLMSEHDFESIDILKIDIEGAEATLFRDGDTAFFRKTRCCAIELHGAECEEAFSNVAIPLGFTCSRQGEITVATAPQA